MNYFKSNSHGSAHYKWQRSCLISLISGLYLVYPALAQESDVNILDTVYVVDDSKVEDVADTNDKTQINSFEAIDEGEINQLVANSLDDILQTSPGATTKGGPRSTSEAPSIRGMDAKKLFIYIDGVKQNFNTDHSSMLALDPDEVKKVDIYKSSSAISQGGSLGGGMRFQTKDANDYLGKDENLGSNIKSSFQQSNKEIYFGAKVYSRIEKNTLFLSATERDAEDVILGNRETLPNSSFNDKSFTAKVGIYQIPKTSLKFSFQNFQRLDTVPLNPTLNPPEEFTDLTGDNEIIRRTYSLTTTHNPESPFVSITSTISQNEQDMNKERLSDGRKETRKIKSVGGSISNTANIIKKKKTKLALSVGAEILKDRLEGTREGGKLTSYPSGISQNNSLFVQADLELNNKLTISPGVRFQTYEVQSDNPEHEDKSDREVSKKLTLSYQWTNALKSSVGYSEGFNGPKIQDLYVDGFHHAGDGFFILDNYFIPNYNIVPERSKTIEVGISYEKNLFSYKDLITFSASQYWTHVKNYLYYEKVEKSIMDEGFGTTQYINIPNTSLRGRELSLGYLYDIFEFNLTYTQSRGVNKTRGIYLADMPADQYTYKVKTNFHDQGFAIGYLGVNTLEQNRTNPGEVNERTVSTPGYFIHGAFIEKSFNKGILEGLRLNARVDNLTNRRYRKHASHIAEVGQDFKMALNYKF